MDANPRPSQSPHVSITDLFVLAGASTDSQCRRRRTRLLVSSNATAPVAKRRRCQPTSLSERPSRLAAGFKLGDDAAPLLDVGGSVLHAAYLRGVNLDVATPSFLAQS